MVILDGHAGAEYDGIAGPMVFSPDSKHAVYVANKDKKWLMVIDGQVCAEYDQILKGSPIFNPDGVLEYLAEKEGSLYRVQFVPQR
jgi:hypothetical protein